LILAGQREAVAAWVAAQIRDVRIAPPGPYEALGSVDAAGNLIGGVIYKEYTELQDGTHDIQMIAAGKPGWLTPSMLRAFFSYPFIQLDCSRITSIVAKAHKKARAFNERLGFRHEGTIRGAFGIGKDGLVYGLLRQECRYIKEK